MKILYFIISLVIYKLICKAINFDYNPFSDGLQMKNLLIDMGIMITILVVVNFVIKKIQNRLKENPALQEN